MILPSSITLSLSLLTLSISQVVSKPSLIPLSNHQRQRSHSRSYHQERQLGSDGTATTITTSLSQNGMKYPVAGAESPTEDTLPQIWLDAYNKAKSEGKIPDIQPSIVTDGVVSYPSSQDLTNVCSWTVQKCNSTQDISMAPPGKVGLSFDDGPSLGSQDLIAYLSANDLSATHFVIGSAIMYNPDIFKAMNVAGVHLGVHTFSHTVQTSKTDLQILGDLGWTLQLIYEVTGKVPMYFRPPEGDVDNRVRAIAKVLGLQTVMWTEDAEDWCLRMNNGTAPLATCLNGIGKSYESVVNEQKSWADNDQSQGFISLEHETTDQAVNAFKEYATELKKKGWKIQNVADLQDLPWYQNQFGKDDPIRSVDSILPTIEAINITDSSAAPGTSNAPDASAFRSSASGNSSSAVSSNARTGSNTASNTTSSSSTSAAEMLSLNLGLFGIGLISWIVSMAL